MQTASLLFLSLSHSPFRPSLLSTISPVGRKRVSRGVDALMVGRESGLEADFLEDWCTRWGIVFHKR